MKTDGSAEGAYIFAVDLQNLRAIQYGKLDEDVTYEHGANIDQWTIKYADDKTKQFAIVKVRFSERFDELIEFEVELSEIPIIDNKGKDVMVNFRMLDGFNANKTFWTDSNALEMQERRLNYNPRFPWSPDAQNISSNFYPVDSAIAIRD